MNIEIVLNGNKEIIASNTTIQELVLSKSLDPLRMVVEVNREIVKREKFGEYQLQQGDTVEMLRFVGGG